MDSISIGRHSRMVTYRTADGIKLGGIVFSNSPRPRMCIIFVHGMAGSVFSNVSVSFARHLGSDFALFSLNNRGSGLVTGFSKQVGRKKSRATIGTNLERFEDCVYDIKGAVDTLAKIGYRNFVLCGHSTGCQKITYYQYKTHDRRIKALVLVAPCDDYSLSRRRLGKKYLRERKVCAALIKSGRGKIIAPDSSGFSAQRLDSLINPSRVEARLYDYNGKLKEFGSLKIPILAVFGDEEENAIKSVGKYLELLDSKSSSRRFNGLLIYGANHSFEGKELELVRSAEAWLEKL